MSNVPEKLRVRGPAASASRGDQPWFSGTPSLMNPGGEDKALGGGLEGASRVNRETLSWSPAFGSPDAIINRAKQLADDRGRDSTLNDGHTSGAVSVHQDSIVGAQYLLTSEPNLTVLNSLSNAGRSAPKFDEVWQAEYAEVVEENFNMIADSEDAWFDAQAQLTFTGQCRLAAGGYVYTGEVLASGEWLRAAGRPVNTAIRMISPSRLCNENNAPDTEFLRRGIVKDANGQAIAYQIRNGYVGDAYPMAGQYTWSTIPARKPWGRRQIIHIMEPREAGQSRGIAEMVSALKHMRMTKHFDEITLQNAVVQASYAAAIESELPPEAVRAMMGGNTGQENFMGAIGQYLTALQSYVGDANGYMLDGVKLPHLFPGTKLTAKPLGTPGGAGYDVYQSSLQRHTCAALGLSYEEFSRNFTGVSYSGAKASMNVSARFMRARKKNVVDRFATQGFQLFLEEDFANGNVPLPRGVSREYFYLPRAKEAFSACSWTGSGVGQIDELKETQAAILRINSGLSNWQSEIARFGKDYRKVFRQRAKEQTLIATLGLTFDTASQKTSQGASAQETQQNNNDPANN